MKGLKTGKNHTTGMSELLWSDGVAQTIGRVRRSRQRGRSDVERSSWLGLKSTIGRVFWDQTADAVAIDTSAEVLIFGNVQ